MNSGAVSTSDDELRFTRSRDIAIETFFSLSFVNYSVDISRGRQLQRREIRCVVARGFFVTSTSAS